MAFILPVFTHFTFFNKYQLPTTDYIVIFNEGAISSTRLIHNHIGKSIVGFWLASTEIKNLDYGLAFNNLIDNNIIIILLSIVILLIIILIIKIFVIKIKSHQRKNLFTFIYSLLTFVILKNIFDGGIFDPVAIPAIFFFLYLIIKNNKKIIIWCGATLYLITHLTLLQLNFYINYYEFKDKLTSGILFILIVSNLLFILERKINRLVILLSIFTLVAIYGFVSNHMISNNMYKNMKIIENESYLTTYKNIPGTKELFSINDLGFYKIIKTDYPNVHDFTQKHNLFYKYSPITTEWVNCIPTSLPNVLEFEIISKQKIARNILENDWMNIKITEENKLGNNLFWYKSLAVFHPCQNRYLNIIGEYIKYNGGETFFIFNPVLDNQKIPF